MKNIPENLKYTKDHEWVRLLDDGNAIIGITDYAQESLGDVTYVELPPVDEAFGQEDIFGVVESVKAASDLFMPISGEVLEANEILDETPEIVNQDPYGEAWMIKVKVTDTTELDNLLSPEDYGAML